MTNNRIIRFFLSVVALVCICIADVAARVKVSLPLSQKSLVRDNRPGQKAVYFRVVLNGADCVISGNSDGSTKVMVDDDGDGVCETDISKMEVLSAADNAYHTIEWERACICAGVSDDAEGRTEFLKPYEIGDCHITMTGGKVHGIYAGGYVSRHVVSDDDYSAYSSGNVSFTMTGGELEELFACGFYPTDIFWGTFTVELLGGTYTGYAQMDFETDPGAITDVFVSTDFTFANESAVPELRQTVEDEENDIYIYNCCANSIICPTFDKKEYGMYGNVVNTRDITIPRLHIYPGTTVDNSEGTIVVTNCGGYTIEEGATVTGNEVTYSSTHSYENLISVRPTCVTQGIFVIKCTKCGNIKSHSQLPLGHDMITIPALPATCEAAGHTAYNFCQRCGQNTLAVAIEAKGHNYGESQTQALLFEKTVCGGNKITVKICQDCGFRKYSTYLSQGTTIAHSFTKTVVSEAGCTADGEVTMSCKNCDLKYTYNPTKLGHSCVPHNEVAPTCEARGTEAYYSCSRCSAKSATPDFALLLLKLTTTLPLGHCYTSQFLHESSNLATAPTCLDAPTYYYTCSRCMDVDKEGPTFVYGNPKGHAYVISSVIADEYTPEVGTADLHCNRCERDFHNYKFSRNTVMARTALNRTSNIGRAVFKEMLTEPTCQKGEAVYTLTLNVDGQTLVKDYNAVLAAVPNKHDWNDDGTCKHCSEVATGAFVSTKFTVTNTEDNTLTYAGEEYTAYSTVTEALAAKLWDDNSEEQKTLGVFSDAALTSDITTENAVDMTVELHGHKLTGAKTLTLNDGRMAFVNGNVEANLIETTDNGELVLDNATLVTRHLDWDGTITKVNGAKLNYVLKDGESFTQKSNVEDVDNCLYTRNLPAESKWGTLCLPYVISSNTDYQLYQLSSTDIAGKKLRFTPVESVAAGVPCVFKKLDADATSESFSTDDTDVLPAGNGKEDALSELTDWTMKGTYETVSVGATLDPVVYFIAENKFWYAEEAVTIPAYRAWFEATASGSAKNLSIEVDDYGFATDITSEILGTADDAPAYDLMGRRVNNGYKGIVVKNGQKTLQ